MRDGTDEGGMGRIKREKKERGINTSPVDPENSWHHKQGLVIDPSPPQERVNPILGVLIGRSW